MSAAAPLFLSHEEVQFLTGFRTPARQIEWLRAKGWRFELNGNRAPVIARRYAEMMLGCGGEADTFALPNFAALRAA